MSVTLSLTYWTGIDLPDIAGDGVDHLIAQYGPNAPRVEAFLRAFLDEQASIDNVVMKNLAGIWPATAVGYQLDLVGKIVGQERGELDDGPYRVLVSGKIFVNKADSQRPQYLVLLVDILGLTEPVVVYEWYPAHLRIVTTLTEYPLQIWELLRTMATAGVDFEYMFSTLTYAHVFTTSSEYGTDVVDANRGTANYTGTTGGRLADIRKLP